MKRIDSIVIQRLADNECTDISDLGEYSSTPGENAIDREERGDMLRGEYRYFNCAMSGEETGNPDSMEQDYQRAEAFQRNEWRYHYMRAVAKVSTSRDESGPWHTQTLKSEGSSIIVSDADEGDFTELGDEQLTSLIEVLKEFGFTPAEIKAARKKLTRKVVA